MSFRRKSRRDYLPRHRVGNHSAFNPWAYQSTGSNRGNREKQMTQNTDSVASVSSCSTPNPDVMPAK